MEKNYIYNKIIFDNGDIILIIFWKIIIWNIIIKLLILTHILILFIIIILMIINLIIILWMKKIRKFSLKIKEIEYF